MGLEVQLATITAMVNGEEKNLTILVVGDERPAGDPITITYSGQRATINGLHSTDISYNATNAIIGG